MRVLGISDYKSKCDQGCHLAQASSAQIWKDLIRYGKDLRFYSKSYGKPLKIF